MLQCYAQQDMHSAKQGNYLKDLLKVMLDLLHTDPSFKIFCYHNNSNIAPFPSMLITLNLITHLMTKQRLNTTLRKLFKKVFYKAASLVPASFLN